MVKVTRNIRLALAAYVLRDCGCTTNEADLGSYIKSPQSDIVQRCRGGKATVKRVQEVIDFLAASLKEG